MTTKSKQEVKVEIKLSPEEIKYLLNLIQHDKSILETLKPSSAKMNRYQKALEVINSVTSKLYVHTF